MDPTSPGQPSGDHSTAPAISATPDSRDALRHAIIANSPPMAAELSPLISDPNSRSDALRIQSQLRREFMGAAIEQARLDPAPRLGLYESMAEGIDTMLSQVAANFEPNPGVEDELEALEKLMAPDLNTLSAMKLSFQASRRSLVLTEGAEVFPVFYCYDWEKVADKLTEAENELLADWYVPDPKFPFTFTVIDNRSLAADSEEAGKVADLLKFLSGKEPGSFDQLLKRFGEVPTILGPERWTVKQGGFEVYGSVFGLRVPYGSYELHQKFLESRQQMVEKGEVAQVSVEISGRIDPAFLAWARGSGSRDLGPVPDVELIYALELPSGANYRFILKEARGYTQKPENDRSSYTPQDHEVLAGLGYYLSSPQVRMASELFTTFRDEDFEPGILPLLEHPWTIDSLRSFMDLERGWVRSLHEQLREYAIESKDDLDSKGWMGVWNGDVLELKSTIWDRLNLLPEQHPEFPPGTLTLTADERERFLTEYVPRLVTIFNRESSRFDREEADPDIHAARLDLQYEGPAAGFALSLDEVLIDLILDMRSGVAKPYPDAVDGFDVSEIYDHLDNASSERSVTAIVYDPLSSDRLTYYSKDALAGLEDHILDTNLSRMLPKVDAYIHQSRASDGVDKDSDPLSAVKLFAKLVGSRRKAISSLEQSIKADEGNHRQISELSDSLRAEKRLLLDIIKETMPVDTDKNCIRLDRITDQHTVRFVFAVDAEGSVRLAEERTGQAGRQEITQSKLVGGQNLYAGGELVFARHQEVFCDLSVWADFDKALTAQGVPTPWSLTELNNRTVGYNVPGSSLPYAENIIFPQLQSQGILLGGVRVIDRLVPGNYL